MDVKGYLTAPIPRWVALSVAISSTVTAATAAYLITRRKLDVEMDRRLEEEVAKSKKFFSNLEAEKEYVTPQQKLKEIVRDLNDESRIVEETIVEEGYVTSDATGDLVEVAKNVFTDAKQTELDPEDIEARDPEKPYIITEKEFFEDDRQTITLTWFEGDEVLADEKDEHIPDIDRVVGEDNLLRFGVGSGDPNVLYVRNEKMEVDFEVVKNEGKYTEQILGFVQHEDSIGVRKFRTYDD